MSLSDLAAVGSFVSGVAVLISLVFLYFQLRQLNAQAIQSERNQRALMNQGVVARTVELVQWMAQPPFNELTVKIASGHEDFSLGELNQLQLQLRLRLVNFQDVYNQYRGGFIDQITYDGSIVSMQYLLAQPVYRALWLSSRPLYATELAAFVDEKLIAGIPLLTPADAMADFKSALAEVKC